MDRWHTGFVDLSGDQGLLGQVEGRTIAAVTGWLNQRDATWREQVAFVAIDMCTIFKAAVRAALPQARLVVDHFHVVQLANQALTEIRRRITVQIRGRRGRKGNREWELRNRLTRSAARMHGSELDPMVDDLQALGRIGKPILAAWNAKEDLLDLLALARTNPDRTVIAERLFRFYDRCAVSGLPVQGKDGGDAVAVPGLGPGLQCPAVERGPFPHPDEPVCARGRRQAGSLRAAVVDDLEAQGLVAVPDDAVDPGGVGVLEDIGDRFLQDPVGRQVDARRQRSWGALNP